MVGVVDGTAGKDSVEVHEWVTWANSVKFVIDQNTEKKKCWGEVTGNF